MNTKIIVGIVIVAVAVLGIFVYMNGDDGKNEAENSAQTSIRQNSSGDTSSNKNSSSPADKVSLEEVAKHNSKSDCWSVIDGKVYDLTSYIPRHTGGDEILRACGVDGTSLFQNRTTSDGQKVGTGTPHSSSAESQLQSLYKADLLSE